MVGVVQLVLQEEVGLTVLDEDEGAALLLTVPGGLCVAAEVEDVELVADAAEHLQVVVTL